VRSKGDSSKDRTMEQDDGFGLGIWGVTEVVDVAIWAQAADDDGAWWSLNLLALGADGHLPVVADPDAGLLAPDKRPPGTRREGTQNGAFLGEGLGAGSVWGGAQFAMDFVLVGVAQELVKQAVGADEFADLIGGQERWKAFLPVVVAALDFAFGLGCGRIEQFDAVEVEGLAQLRKGVGVVGVEEGVKVHVEGQRQSVGLEGTGQEIEMGQEGFAGVEARASVVTGGIVQNIQQRLFVGLAGQPGVGTGVVLPERAVVAGLPAFDGFGRGFVAGVRGQLVFDGPATDAGAVGLEVEPPVQFAGEGVVGGGWFGGQEFGQQGYDLLRPSRAVIAAGNTGGPNLDLTLGAGAEVLAVEFVEAGPGQSQFASRCPGREITGSMAGQKMTNQWSGQTFDEL
jgi:hypothetical protein